MVRLVEHLQRSYPDAREQLVRIRPALVAADPAAMEGFLALVAADFGSIDGYVAELGLTTTAPFLRANLLEP